MMATLQSLVRAVLLMLLLPSAQATPARAATPFDVLETVQASPRPSPKRAADEASGLSGMFYDPARAGEGFVIDVIADDRAAIYWFSYDKEGRQRWLLGLARIEADGLTVDTWIVTRGARFGAAFRAEDVAYSVAGSGRFEVQGCDRLALNYTIDGETGTQHLVRLTAVADLPCTSARDHRSGLSGSWFDPQREGEGVVLHVHDSERASAVFFTYDAEGHQMWVLGSGRIERGRLVLEAPFTTSGGRFGEPFDPADVVYHPWGALELTLDCDDATLRYTPRDPALEPGGSSMGRLTRLLGHSCDDGSTFEIENRGCGDFQRRALLAETLRGTHATGLVDNRAFTPDTSCAPAREAFEGSLRLPQTRMSTSRVRDYPDTLFPDANVALTTVGDYLVPLDPDLIWPSGTSSWQVVFAEGRVWSEPADDGWSRAALPFTLSHYQWNEAHHGLMTFLYKDGVVSPAHLQIVQENLPWDSAWDAWAAIAATQGPADPAQAYAAERAFRRDLALRLPVRPWHELEARYGAAALQHFNRGIAVEAISQAGIAVDGQLFLQTARTRGGDHPYPEAIRHGAFSVSKSAGAAVALLRLAQKYGPAVFDERIADHIQVTARHRGWDAVTFGDALSMVTGIGDAHPSRNAAATFADEGDEANPNWRAFNYWLWQDQRLQGAFGFGNYPWGPGEVMRYNSSQTMILAVAMDNYLKSREGPQADLWRMLNEEVFTPIGIRWLPSMRLRHDHYTPGAVPLGWGLLPNPHDVVRIARLLQADGRWNGEQLLHPQRTRRALRKDRDPAWPTSRQLHYRDGAYAAVAYRDGLWSAPVDPFGHCPAIASYMEGVGGNFVVMMPSGVTLFRFTDANVYDAGALMLSGEAIAGSCP